MTQEQTAQGFTPEQFERLKAEANAPYRPLRQFVYFAFAASGFLGGFVLLSRWVSGQDPVGTALPNVALQVGVVALMVWLFRLDREKSDRKER
ncbi:MAG: DUF3493 domain-containing protein [Coleofasciculaceae cyanobacterium SM2_3_26]|nr:DUF3493 domain-containing protein [Coleofasciculaceae cyanobacterium SM2_3_26]